jgi:hypothetical protein
MDGGRSRQPRIRNGPGQSGERPATIFMGCNAGSRCLSSRRDRAEHLRVSVEAFPAASGEGKNMGIAVGSLYGTRSAVETASETNLADANLQ